MCTRPRFVPWHLQVIIQKGRGKVFPSMKLPAGSAAAGLGWVFSRGSQQSSWSRHRAKIVASFKQSSSVFVSLMSLRMDVMFSNLVTWWLPSPQLFNSCKTIAEGTLMRMEAVICPGKNRARFFLVLAGASSFKMFELHWQKCCWSRREAFPPERWHASRCSASLQQLHLQRNCCDSQGRTVFFLCVCHQLAAPDTGRNMQGTVKERRCANDVADCTRWWLCRHHPVQKDWLRTQGILKDINVQMTADVEHA